MERQIVWHQNNKDMALACKDLGKVRKKIAVKRKEGEYYA
jgi:hypothetical protein